MDSASANIFAICISAEHQSKHRQKSREEIKKVNYCPCQQILERQLCHIVIRRIQPKQLKRVLIFTNSAKPQSHAKFVNESVVHLIEYLLEQRPSKLLYITICSEDCVEIAKIIAKHPSEFHCDKETSLSICKLIIALATYIDMNIKTMTLSPVILRKDELEYLVQLI